MREQLLEKKLARAKGQVAALGRLIEEKSLSLYLAREQLLETTRFLESVLGALCTAVLVVDLDGRIREANRAALELTGYERSQLLGAPASLVMAEDLLQSSSSGTAGRGHQAELRAADGTSVGVLFSSAPLFVNGVAKGTVCTAHDIREQKRLETQLRHAQKLESVGQLAAGVAHEINTPVQFTGDSVQFLKEAFRDYEELLGVYDELRSLVGDEPRFAAAVGRLQTLEEEIDIDFLKAEVPDAVDRAIDGVQRVAKIVKAMKSFAHPGQDEMAPNDLNRAIATTLEVCRSEYKYCANVQLELGELPSVVCNLGDVNQVLLNLIVNAAHAIQDRSGDKPELGDIVVRTLLDGETVVIEISDTGGGIPVQIQERIFDPFFTTKAVGRGTGQGLAISRSLIVDKHGGELTFTTALGQGTTFRIALPIKGCTEVAR